MNAQVNVRLPQNLLVLAKERAQKQGYGSIQEFIKEAVREKLFEEELTKKELAMVKRIIKLSEERNLYGTEEELFKKLRQ
ncbi:MAG: ribbon-helix-helix domain-containing protein [archaeon]